VEIVAVSASTSQPISPNAAVTVTLRYSLTPDNNVSSGSYSVNVWFERFSDPNCQSNLLVDGGSSIGYTTGYMTLSQNAADNLSLNTTSATLDGPYVAVEANIANNGSTVQNATDFNRKFCYQVGK
jgi:hypothetical protein